MCRGLGEEVFALIPLLITARPLSASAAEGCIGVSVPPPVLWAHPELRPLLGSRPHAVVTGQHLASAASPPSLSAQGFLDTAAGRPAGSHAGAAWQSGGVSSTRARPWAGKGGSWWESAPPPSFGGCFWPHSVPLPRSRVPVGPSAGEPRGDQPATVPPVLLSPGPSPCAWGPSQRPYCMEVGGSD